MKRLVLVLVSAVILAGCTSLGRDIRMYALEQPQPKNTYKIITNYKIGETTTSNIGTAMIKAEDIIINAHLSWYKEPAFRTSYDFELTGAFQTRRLISVNAKTIKYNANSVLNVVGEVHVNGSLNYIINMANTDYNFLVTEKGYFVADKFLTNEGDHHHYIDIINNMKSIPNEIVFDFYPPLDNKYQTFTKLGSPGSFRSASNYESVMYSDRPKNVPEINYELIYGGKDSTALHIVYREYTSEGVARQAFFQNLNYENNAKTIRFKNTNIEVLSADNEKIVFRVIEDDISNLENNVNALFK